MSGRPEPGAARPRALVVDDEAAVRLVLTLLLAKAGWDTVAVSSGAEALKAFIAGRFQRAICDVDLGRGIDGLETARRLQALEPSLKVVFITGSPVHAQRAEAVGTGPVLMKPFLPAEILALFDHGR